jgi:3-oxoacyl-[acyl-carrier protein] reductase
MDAPKTMLLTGCASGIGRHLTTALSRLGHRIVATDLDGAELARQATEHKWSAGQVKLEKLDVRSESEWETALDLAGEAFGALDVLFNVAGFLNPGYVVDLASKDIDLHFDVNVKGTILGTRAAARRMLPNRSGHIINFGSLASLAPVPGLSLYSASKFAVRGFSLAAAGELLEQGIAVTLIMPDAVQTPMLDLQVDHEEAAMTFSGSRALTVEEIAELVIRRVLPQRPLEIAVPATRAFLARVANTAPQVSRLLAPVLIRKGKRKQRGIKRGASGA